jgi:hypothetical protein
LMHLMGNMTKVPAHMRQPGHNRSSIAEFRLRRRSAPAHHGFGARVLGPKPRRSRFRR